MRVYEFVLVLNPTELEREQGGQPKIISKGVQAVLANDQNQAGMLAGQFIPAEHADKTARIEVVLRPFRD